MYSPSLEVFRLNSTTPFAASGGRGREGNKSRMRWPEENAKKLGRAPKLPTNKSSRPSRSTSPPKSTDALQALRVSRSGAKLSVISATNAQLCKALRPGLSSSSAFFRAGTAFRDAVCRTYCRFGLSGCPGYARCDGGQGHPDVDGHKPRVVLYPRSTYHCSCQSSVK